MPQISRSLNTREEEMIFLSFYNYSDTGCPKCARAHRGLPTRGFLSALMCKTLIGPTLLFSHPHVVDTVPDFSVILTHVAGTCPIYDSEAMKKFQELSEKREEAAQRFGVKIVSKWSPTRIHQTYWIIEAPSKKAAEDYFKAVGLSIWNKIEVQEIKRIK